MAFRVIVAGRCSTPKRSAWTTLLAGMRKYQDMFGPMHWQPAPLLVELVQRGLSIAEWEANERGARR